MRYLIIICQVIAGLVLLPGHATGQEVPARDFPPPFEISNRYRALADSALAAESEMAVLAATEAIRIELEEIRQVHVGLEQLLSTFLEAEFVRPERLSRLQDHVVVLNQRLRRLQETISNRIQTMGGVRSTWLASQEFWQAWRDALMPHPDYAVLEPELEQALQRIAALLERVQVEMQDLVSLHYEIETHQAEIARTLAGVSSVMAGTRAALQRRDQPLLFSPAHLEQLWHEPWLAWRPVEADEADVYVTFASDHATLFLFHVLLTIILGYLLRALQRLAISEGVWSLLLARPWAMAIFLSTVLLAPRYVLTPPLWDVVIWSILAVSGAALVTRLFSNHALHRLIFFFAIFYPVFLFAEAIRIPVPLFRLGLIGTAAAGILLFLFLLRVERRTGASSATRWVIHLGILMWGVVGIADVLGFHHLSRWILHSAVTSAFYIFVVVFLVVLTRGVVHTLLNVEAKGRLRFLRNVAIPLVGRIVPIFQAIFVFAALLAVLSIWGLAPSPGETWRQITDYGITFAGIHITLGRLLLAAAMIYLSVLASWLLRTFAAYEIYPRWELERGVGDSISSLLHYSLITVAVLLALGALGVELQNFAIIAGALGVGIGFGLQNIVNNFVSGLILLFERPIRVGDTIVIDGELGAIKKIGLRSTVVTTFDQAEVIVPNADLVSEKVINWTLSNPTARLIIPVGVAYGSDVADVLETLRQSGKIHPAVLDEPAPQALFTGFGDSSLDFELRVWVRELRSRMEVRSAVLSEVDRRFREKEIEIPFPQRDLHLRSVDSDIIPSRGEGL